MATIPLGTAGVTDYIQSGFLHLAAAGSDGTDNSAHGNHLRWQLLGNLGKKHLPKGLLSNSGTYATTIAYNRNNDYVTLYRALYLIDQYRTAVNMVTTNPTTIVSSGSTREWQFAGIIPVATVTSNTNTIIVRFTDVAQYDYWAGIYNPSSARDNFLRNYSGIIEAWVVGKVCLSAWMGTSVINSNGAAEFRSESLSVPDTTDSANKILSGRKTETNTAATQVELRGENIESIRFSYSNLYPRTLSFQCYADYILGINKASKNGNWTEVGNYSLSITDTETNDRLEKVTQYVINQTWPRYYGSNPTTGEYTVNVANYLNKWSPGGSELGIKQATMAYLDKSKTDVFAMDSLASDTNGDAAHYDLSYLETLKLIALDFHFARMLGLGSIDVPGNSSTYIYGATYKTAKDPADETQTLATLNVFLSLPVSESTHRLPVTPVLKPVSYGLSVNNATSTPTQLTDEYGFALYDDIRFVNLEKESYPFDRAPGIFYESSTNFCMADVTRPVLFGVKYKLNSENDWRSPEISNDPDYQDAAENNEVVPFPETNGPFFTHLETEEGIHDYAVYGVNLFSRVTDLSNTKSTDGRDFPVRNTLLPPSNLQVQLIQPENPRMFTTANEQSPLLSGISGTDKTLVRATFEWNEAHNIAYQAADKVDFYFCDHAPLTVRGVVGTVTDIGNNQVEVTLSQLVITSTNPSQTIVPTINSGDVSRFTGSQLAAGQQLFQVDSVVTPGNSPVLRINKQKQTQSQEYPIGSNQFITTESYSAPIAGDMIMLVENMSNTANWSTHLVKQVSIIPFTPLHTETVTMADGSQKVLNYGGHYASANIDQVLESGNATGIYYITYSNYSLPTITDTDTDWYKGSVRLLSDGTDPVMKKLEVWKIEDLGSDLRLTVFDPAFQSDPIVTGNTPSRTNVNVNFHPGYKVYLYKDNQSGNNFTASAILPAIGDGSKITYMAIRSMDTTLTPDLTSSLSVPVPLLAREIIVPAAPLAIVGPDYATRPDVYGKSTYTFDVEMDTTGGRKPFGLMFFRTNERKLLDTLYKAETLVNILNDLSDLVGDDADYYEQRMKDLASGEIDTAADAFKKYGAGTYRLPNPDNDELEIPDPSDPDVLIQPFNGSYSLTAIQDELKAALNAAFQLITEQPVIFRYLKSGRKTSGKKPLFRDENGQLIPPVLPTDPGYNVDEYDPFPMAVTYTDGGNTFVRFTDYGLDGAASGLYFYYALEFSDMNVLSGRSPVSDPVKLVNTKPAEAPAIKSVRLNPEPLKYRGTDVVVTVNPYSSVHNIKKLRLYRTNNQSDSVSIRTMTLASETELYGAFEPVELIDTFYDQNYPLYGDIVFYRVVAIRETKDENGNQLLVPSDPSELGMLIVADPYHPEPPVIVSRCDSYTSTELTDLTLSWEQVAHNATYRLLQKTAAGDWILIYEIQSNDALIEYTFEDPVVYVDVYSDAIPLTFKIDVVNVSGLKNRYDRTLTIVDAVNDLRNQKFDVIAFEDDYFELTPIRNHVVPTSTTDHPGSITITDLSGPLPAGHTFDSLEITIEDNQNHTCTKTITTADGSVVFEHNDGNGLILNGSVESIGYKIMATLYTDICTGGFTYIYQVGYGPVYELASLSPLVAFKDADMTEIQNLHAINRTLQIPLSVFPTTLEFVDVAELPVGHQFDEITIKLTDDLGGQITKSITVEDGSVLFTNGESDPSFPGIALENSNNRTYTVDVTYYTDLCQGGTKRTQVIEYTATPCTAVKLLTDVLSLEDASHVFGTLITSNIDDGISYPGRLIFTDIAQLPSGHTFDRIEITVKDPMGGQSTKTIAAQAGDVMFQHGDGNLHLNSSNPNLVYNITVKVFTDLCQDGASFRYIINYSHL